MTDFIGKSLGRYHILESLGQGGMATVFKAFDTSLQRNVAIKIIRPDVGEIDPTSFLKRFQREARALAQLDHPYILKVLDYGEQEGIPYLVMPFVPGGTLKQKMGAAMPYQQAAILLAPIARALEHAHQQNVIHRDVKPANILISQSGAPLLSDFGIAKVIASEGSTQLTGTGASIGTPDYMAPEQWLGVSNPGTDIYSLGVVFYEMVTGRKPYSADTPAAVMLKHMHDPLPRPTDLVPGLPEGVEQVIFRALEKDPANRFQGMASFAAALEKLAQADPAALSGSLWEQNTLPGEKTTISDSAVPPAKTRLAAAPTAASPQPVQKSSINYLLLGGIGLFGLILVCLVAAGLIFFARNLRTSKPNATTPTVTQVINPPNDASTPVPQATVLPPVTTKQPEATETSTALAPLVTIEGLPGDVPVLKDNNGDLTTTLNQGISMYSFTSNTPFKLIGDFYLVTMQKSGWKLLSTSTQGNAKMWAFQKDPNRTAIITVNQLRGKNMISIMLPSTSTPPTSAP